MTEINKYLSKLKNIFFLLFIISTSLSIATRALKGYCPEYFLTLPKEVELYELINSAAYDDKFMFALTSMYFVSLILVFKEKALGVYLALLSIATDQLSGLIFDHVSINRPIFSLLEEINGFIYYAVLTIVSLKITLNKKFDLSKVEPKNPTRQDHLSDTLNR